MIIWDEKKQEHFIRIKGEERVRIGATDFQIDDINKQIETAIKSKVNTRINKEDYNIFVHIFDKSVPDYVLNLRPLSSGKPKSEWWLPRKQEGMLEEKRP